MWNCFSKVIGSSMNPIVVKICPPAAVKVLVMSFFKMRPSESKCKCELLPSIVTVAPESSKPHKLVSPTLIVA